MAQDHRDLPIEYLDTDMAHISVSVITEGNFTKIAAGIQRLKNSRNPSTQAAYTGRQPALDELASSIEAWNEAISRAQKTGTTAEVINDIHLESLINVFQILNNAPELYVNRPKGGDPYSDLGFNIDFLLSRLSAGHHGLVPANSTVTEQLEFLNKLRFGKLAPPTAIPDRYVVMPNIQFPEDAPALGLGDDLQARLDAQRLVPDTRVEEETFNAGALPAEDELVAEFLDIAPDTVEIEATATRAPAATLATDADDSLLVEFLNISPDRVDIDAAAVADTSATSQAPPPAVAGSWSTNLAFAEEDTTEAVLDDATLLDEKVQKPGAVAKTKQVDLEQKLVIFFDNRNQILQAVLIDGALQPELNEALASNLKARAILVVPAKGRETSYGLQRNNEFINLMPLSGRAKDIDTRVDALIAQFRENGKGLEGERSVRSPVLSSRVPGLGALPDIDSDLGAGSDRDSELGSSFGSDPRTPRSR